MNHPPGTIIHFRRFQFGEPATATRPATKNKFFIVLRNLAGRLVLATLPTSQDRIPEAVEQVHGCLDFETGGWKAYLFEAGRAIATNGWAFSKRTYLYGFQVEEYNYVQLESTHSIPGSEMEIKGRLVMDEFNALRDCLCSSIDLKRRYRNALNGAEYDEGTVQEPAARYGS